MFGNQPSSKVVLPNAQPTSTGTCLQIVSGSPLRREMYSVPCGVASKSSQAFPRTSLISALAGALSSAPAGRGENSTTSTGRGAARSSRCRGVGPAAPGDARPGRSESCFGAPRFECLSVARIQDSLPSALVRTTSKRSCPPLPPRRLSRTTVSTSSRVWRVRNSLKTTLIGTVPSGRIWDSSRCRRSWPNSFERASSLAGSGFSPHRSPPAAPPL
mmetsp:Transcript_84626/g.236156  ORF Transcript_84626/g.236156 Transcript_84626/m.236156 type:complete len:216 (-) Transcript_84626:123-770(-)